MGRERWAGPELVIFDCDGVLVDSDRISLRIQAEWLTGLGLATSYEDCVRDFLGIGMSATVAEIERRLGGPLPDHWARDLEKAVRDAFADELRPVPGIEAALDALPMATCVASSGSHAKMRYTLGLTGLWSFFEGRIFSGDEVEHGKPAPDLFLHAARSMAVAPDRCVVVEDSPYGVRAARAAGMRVVGYTATTSSAAMAEADELLTNMADLPDLIADMHGHR